MLEFELTGTGETIGLELDVEDEVVMFDDQTAQDELADELEDVTTGATGVVKLGAADEEEGAQVPQPAPGGPAGGCRRARPAEATVRKPRVEMNWREGILSD